MAGDPRDLPKFLVQLLFSLIFVGIGVWILGGNHNPDLEKVACGWMGAVLGFWLS
jgi:hypothetical protein